MHRVVCIKLLFAVDGYSTYAALLVLCFLLAYDYALLYQEHADCLLCVLTRSD